jgi:RNA 3'-terminal phosphate cyclase (ATP)
VEVILERMPARGKGTLLLLLAEFEGSQACATALGELGKPAERVADEAADALLAALDSGAAVDEHLADQLLLPMAFASGPSSLRTARVTQHLLTNAQVIQDFGAAEVQVEGELGEPGLVRVAPLAR